mgnify:CR=1 FL=1
MCGKQTTEYAVRLSLVGAERWIRDRSKRVGRINYAELGIVQLGSVYEGLLSYKGFFAAEDRIQVHQKAKNGKPMLDNAVDAKMPTWFVPAHRENEIKPAELALELSLIHL